VLEQRVTADVDLGLGDREVPALRVGERTHLVALVLRAGERLAVTVAKLGDADDPDRPRPRVLRGHATTVLDKTPGVDTHRFHPDLRDEALLPGEISVLYAGRLTTEKGVDLLADAFLAARERDPRLHLCLAGGGPEEGALRKRLGGHATFLGWLHGDALARAYASADVFLFASRTDTFGQVLLEAQASGLPVVAVDEGGPQELVDDGVTGLLRPAAVGPLAEALLDLARVPAARRRLARAGRQAVAERSWERALERLADGYRNALGKPATAAPERRVA
jgi:glycosyltransferase involved in cell wall biosynthesis